MQAMEMKYLRRVRGVTKRYRLKSSQIKEDLEVVSILQFIEMGQLSWCDVMGGKINSKK